MKILNLLILLVISNNVFAQKTLISDLEKNSIQYKVVYLLTYQPNKSNPNNLQTEEMYLYLDEGMSKFGSAGKIVGDSIMANRGKDKKKSRSDFLRLMAKIPDTKFNYLIYKGIPKTKMTFSQNIFKDDFKYETSKDQFEWEIHSETKKFENLNIQRATTEFAGRYYTAWFTSEIPVSDGPYKFNGLPGLIVKIRDDKGHYSFELKEIKILKNPFTINIPTKDYIETNREKLGQLIQEDKENPMRAMESAGVSIEFSKQQKRDLRTSKMKRNNPIELE
jgi:GLPGLI family protein